MTKVSSEMWIVLFVAAVAAVGVGLMLAGGVSSSSEDLSGEAIAAKTVKATTAKTALKSALTTASHYCTDSDSGQDEYTKGTTKGEIGRAHV